MHASLSSANYSSQATSKSSLTFCVAPPIASDNQLCAFSHGRESIQRRLAQRCESSPQKKAHWGKEAETQLRLDDKLERKLGETSTFHQGVWRPVCFNASSSSSKTNDFRTINSAPPKTSWVFHMFCNMASTSIGIIMVLASMTIVISMLCVLDFSFSNMYVKTYYGFRAENSIDCFRPNFQERTLTLWAMHWFTGWEMVPLSPNERTCSTGVSLWCGTTSRCWRGMTRKPFLIIHTSAGMRSEASCAASAIICLCFGCARTRECADRNLEVGWARSLEKREIRCQTRCGNFLGHPDGNNTDWCVVWTERGNSSWRCSSWIDGQLSSSCVCLCERRETIRSTDRR